MKSVTCETYARKIISRHVRHISRNIPGAKDSRNTECVHQLRVGARRFRNAIWVFSRFMPGKEWKRWSKSVRKAARVCGEARDLDVQIAFIRNLRRRKRNEIDIAGLDRLAGFLSGKRATTQGLVVKSLERFETDGTIGKVSTALDSLPSGNKAHSSSTLRKHAVGRIGKRMRELRSYEFSALEPSDADELHQLRIAAKHLRYTIEAFEPFIGKILKPYRNSAKKIQNTLGELHDYDVWSELLPGYIAENQLDHQLVHGVRLALVKCRSLRPLAYKRFRAFWDSLAGGEHWTELMKVVSSPEVQSDEQQG